MNHEIYQQLASAVVGMKADEVKRLSRLALEQGLPADEAIEKGLAAGMNEVGRLFAAKEYFVPEVLVCAKAMYEGFDILKDKVVKGKITDKGAIVIGVVEGDFHDIGKNIVKLMLEAAGFRIIDLGKNVRPEKFLNALQNDKNISIAALSTLMTTTMENIEAIARKLLEVNQDLKIMVGGAPVNQDFARHIGAHFYGEDARQAVLGARQLMGLEVEA